MTDTCNTDVITLGRKGAVGPDRNLMHLRRYWNSMRVGSDVPRRSDIDPRGIQNLLANALIAEKIAPGLARLRIAGQHLSELMGMEVRGMPISAFITPDHRDQLARALVELFERPAVVTARLRAPGSLRHPRMCGSLILLPLRSDLGDVSRALGCLVTSGAIGSVPRRFEIADLQVEPVDKIDVSAPVPPPPVFADPAPGFTMDRPALPSERSYLRLVKSE